MPREISMAAPQTAVGVSRKPGRSIGEAARIAAPRPMAARFGTFSGPLRPSSARPSAQATAIWPRVLAPSSPKAAASGAPPQPTESITSRKARGISRSGGGRAGPRRGAPRRAGRRRARGRRRAWSAASSAAWTRASGVSGSTAAPRPIRLSRPTAWSIASEARRRPPPSSTTARPRPRVSMPATKPSRPAATSATCGAPARWASKRSRKPVGPPRAATMRSKRSAAAPNSKASAMRSAPSASSVAMPPSTRSSAPSATVTSQSRLSTMSPAGSGRRSPSRARCRRRSASGSFMSVTSARVRQPAPFATCVRLPASASASSSVAMKAPVPTLTSRTSASRPAASFFERIEAVIRSIDSTVPVTSRMA